MHVPPQQSKVLLLWPAVVMFTLILWCYGYALLMLQLELLHVRVLSVSLFVCVCLRRFCVCWVVLKLSAKGTQVRLLARSRRAELSSWSTWKSTRRVGAAGDPEPLSKEELRAHDRAEMIL